MLKKYCILFILLPIFLIAEDKDDDPDIGLTAAIQESHFDIQIPIWLSNDIIIAPSVGLMYQSNIGYEFDFGLNNRFFLSDGKIRPFMGLKLGVIYSAISEGETGDAIDLLGGIGFGGEYFFDNNFSLGIEAQLNGVLSDNNSLKFSNPNGININTAAVLFASIYF